MHTHEKKAREAKERRERNQLSTASMYQYKSTSVQFYTFYTCFGAGVSDFISSQVTRPGRFVCAADMTTDIWLHQSSSRPEPCTQQEDNKRCSKLQSAITWGRWSLFARWVSSP